jgi:hypothetical protein
MRVVASRHWGRVQGVEPVQTGADFEREAITWEDVEPDARLDLK